jgi:hypothetical protein
MTAQNGKNSRREKSWRDDFGGMISLPDLLPFCATEWNGATISKQHLPG